MIVPTGVPEQLAPVVFVVSSQFVPSHHMTLLADETQESCPAAPVGEEHADDATSAQKRVNENGIILFISDSPDLSTSLHSYSSQEALFSTSNRVFLCTYRCGERFLKQTKRLRERKKKGVISQFSASTCDVGEFA